MKHIFAASAFAVCLLFNSCASTEVNNNMNRSVTSSSSPSSNSTSKSTSPSLDEQAKTEVKTALEGTSLCKSSGSDSYFTYSRVITSSGYTEHKNPSFTIESTSPLTEADRLNDVTWKGKVQYRFTASRNNENGAWSDWRPYESLAMYVISVVKRGGAWQIEPGLFARMHVKGECEDSTNSDENSTSGFTGKETDISPDVKKISSDEWEIILPANLQQLDTEKFSEPISVQKGQTIIISADGKVNSSGYKTPNDGSYKVVGANGWSSNPSFNSGRRSPLPSTAPFMALAMRIGSGKLPVDDGRWTLIGSQKTVVADSDDFLHFTVNDMNDPTGQSDWWINNEGGVKIRVQIQ